MPLTETFSNEFPSFFRSATLNNPTAVYTAKNYFEILLFLLAFQRFLWKINFPNWPTSKAENITDISLLCIITKVFIFWYISSIILCGCFCTQVRWGKCFFFCASGKLYCGEPWRMENLGGGESNTVEYHCLVLGGGKGVI